MSEPWPLYDLFLDLPHPAASPACPPPFIVEGPSPSSEQVAKELAEAASIERIARFAFPEHDDQASPPPAPSPGGAGLNRYDVYSTKGFQRHTFSLQLSTGQRVHGHVRRYLPMHQEAPTRYDVGRRGVRASVLLTRASAGDSTYAALLKTVEAISALQASGNKELLPHANPQQRFLATCQEQHVGLCRFYAGKPDDERRPMLVTIDGTEFGSPKLRGIDTSRFLLPTSLLQPPNAVTNISGMTESPILPLLRCLGVPNSLRLLSALLSERRVVLISNSPTRLTACARSILSILAQGQLHWQHLFIPVLPPHLFQYLQAPMPYLVGMLSSNMDKLDQMQELGEILLIQLDQNALETRGIPTNLIATRIPDLVRTSSDMELNANGYTEMSAVDCLIKDLVELIKMDKRTMSGETAVQETAAQTVKAVKSALGKLKSKGQKIIQKQLSADSDSFSGRETPQEIMPALTLEDEVYFECVQNDVGEEEARIAFCMFFLCAYGDMRCYLMPGAAPQLDRDRFLQQKRAKDGEAIFPLYQNMCQSQMFEQFVNERVEEIRTRMPVAKDSPLFAVCAHYHRKNQIDFSIASVRRVARQVAQANPGRLVSQANANARRLAMAITSNKTYEGNRGQAVAQLVEMAHETSSVLCDIMSVIWMRIHDCRGMQWKHGLFALQILRNLLYHGPLAAIPEATDGIDKIRLLQTYGETMRVQNSQHIQMAAAEVYNLLVDRAKLFAIRRVCADRRRIMRNPPQGQLPKDTRLRIGISFRNIHAALHPNSRRQVAPAPGHPTQQQRNAPPAQVQDLLGFDSPAAAPAPSNVPPPATQTNVNDFLGLFEAQASIAPAPAGMSFGSGAPVRPQHPSTPVKDPFGPTSPAPTQRQPSPQPPRDPFDAGSQQQLPPQPSSQPPIDLFGAVSPVPQQQQRPPQQPMIDPFGASSSVPQQQQRPPQQPPNDPFGASSLVPQQRPPQQPPIDPFAPQQQQSSAPGPQQQMVPVQHQAGPPEQHRAGPFGGPQPGMHQQGYPGMQAMQGRPHPNMQSPPGQQQQHPPYPGAQYPPQQQQVPNGYPGQQQPNIFAPPAAQQPPPPRKNLSQFDPMSR